jgi:hypothetical protein
MVGNDGTACRSRSTVTSPQIATVHRWAGWQWWELLARIDGPGETTLRARATDLVGRTRERLEALIPQAKAYFGQAVRGPA